MWGLKTVAVLRQLFASVASSLPTQSEKNILFDINIYTMTEMESPVICLFLDDWMPHSVILTPSGQEMGQETADVTILK